jgi:hypothetical protein
MSQDEDPRGSVVAVFRDHESVERAVRRLHDEGFDMRNLSIVGRNFQVSDEPAGFVTTGDCAGWGADVGSFMGGIFGLFIGMGFLILPGLGLVIVAGPLTAALLGGIEGSAAGAVVGGLVGALVGWGVPGVHAAKYETHVKGGNFLVLARGGSKAIEHAKSVLSAGAPDSLENYEGSPNRTNSST